MQRRILRYPFSAHISRARFSRATLFVPACVFSLLLFSPAQAQRNGEQIYTENCAGCHEAPDTRAPETSALRQMSAARIVRSMDFGIMMSVTYMLDRAERNAVAEFLGTPDEGREPHPAAWCSDRRVSLDMGLPSAWNGWSPQDDNSRFQLEPGFFAHDVANLELAWAFAFDGDVNAFAPPAVFGSQLFVGSAGGLIQALDSETGCLRWQYQADGPVRTAMRLAELEDPQDGANHAVFFGDQSGNFFAVGAETGQLLWRARPEPHESTKLTGSPIVHDGVVFVPTASWEESRPLNPEYICCTFRGSIAAYDGDSGELIWQQFLVEELPAPIGQTDIGVPIWGPSGAGTWSAPTLDRDRGVIYATTGNNYTGMTPYSDAVVALSLRSGEILWSRQLTPGDEFNLYCRRMPDGCPGEDFDIGASAILQSLPGGASVLVVGQKSGYVYGLDPDDSGRLRWQVRVGEGGINGGVLWGMASDGENVYAAVSDLARRAQSDRDAVDPRPNGVDPTRGGGLTAINLATGRIAWHKAAAPCDPVRPVCSPAQPAAVTVMPGVVFSGAVDGILRAFSTRDGSMLWSFDTAQSFDSVNRVSGRGGSIDGDGAVIANGMVYITSGYGRNGGMPGNVLLAFKVPEN